MNRLCLLLLSLLIAALTGDCKPQPPRQLDNDGTDTRRDERLLTDILNCFAREDTLCISNYLNDAVSFYAGPGDGKEEIFRFKNVRKDLHGSRLASLLFRSDPFAKMHKIASEGFPGFAYGFTANGATWTACLIECKQPARDIIILGKQAPHWIFAERDVLLDKGNSHITYGVRLACEPSTGCKILSFVVDYETSVATDQKNLKAKWFLRSDHRQHKPGIRFE